MMKSYPSISRDVRYGRDWFVFDKLDGSNIRAEWSKKKGFYKFGSRKVLIGSDALLAEAIDLIDVLEKDFRKIFDKQKTDRVVCFFEFHGPSSFAGMHVQEEHQVTLIDAHVHKHGMLDPRDFLKRFEGSVPTAELLHRGNFNHEMEAEVRAGEFKGMTFEGVVVKGIRDRKWSTIPMFKVKNKAWLDRLKEIHADRFEELA